MRSTRGGQYASTANSARRATTRRSVLACGRRVECCWQHQDCGRYGRTRPKPTYTIAYEGPLSGGDAQLGLNMKFAVALAINQANAGKTFGKSSVQVEVHDR